MVGSGFALALVLPWLSDEDRRDRGAAEASPTQAEPAGGDAFALLPAIRLACDASRVGG